MSKDISAKYYQDKTEKIQKKIEKDIKVLLKKKKSNNIVVKDTKIYQNMKNKSWLSMQINIKLEKKLHHNYKKLYRFRKSVFFFSRLG